MKALTRRLFLSRVPAAVAIGVTPAVVLASVEPPEAMTPEHRIEAAMKEIEAALQERYPGFKLQTRFDIRRPKIYGEGALSQKLFTTLPVNGSTL